MITCDHCQHNLLLFVYDLLDGDEARALRVHLESCPACQSARERASEQQGVLGEAVKESYPSVRFTPPTETIPLPRKPQPVRGLSRLPMRWAAAASVLLCLLGLGGYLGYANWKERQDAHAAARGFYARTEKEVDVLRRDAATQQERLRNEIRAINAQVDELLGNWKKDEQKSRKVFEAHKTKFIVETPGSLQAGARNEITINLVDDDAKEGASKALRAQIVNADTREVVFEQPFKGTEPHRITLPQDLPLKPGAKLDLVIEAQGPDGAPFQIIDHLRLSSPEYLTHLYLDRPLYRPGESVYFRTLTLDRFSLKPAEAPMQLRVRLLDNLGAMLQEVECSSRIVTPLTHEPILGPDGTPVQGIATGEFVLPALLSPGEYSVEVSDAQNRFPAEKRSFQVDTWQTPLLLKELKFDRSSYGPGEKVQVHGTVRLASGARTEKLQGMVTVNLDGSIVFQNRLPIDATGAYRSSFLLPQQMVQGIGSVAIDFEGPGIREQIIRPLPIVLNKVLVDFYPEGGKLIAGLPGRIYFQAQTPQGKPADVAGEVVDSRGRVVATAKTLTDEDEAGINQGLGQFEFTPQAGEKYRLRIGSPAKLEEKEFPLPDVAAEGISLRLSKGVVKQEIEVVLHSTRDTDLLVGAYCRGKLLDHAPVKMSKQDRAVVRLHAPPDVSGVYRITVFEKKKDRFDFAHLAERLIYSKGSERLGIFSAVKNQRFAPGGPVNLDIEIKDEKKRPVPSIALVAVVDQGVMKLADDQTLRSMPLHFLLTSEIRRARDLENADVFLGNHPRAEESLDLLLGVQGWRLFVEQDPARLELDQFASTRMLGGMAPTARRAIDPAILALEQKSERHAQKYLELQKSLAELEKEEESHADREEVIRDAEQLALAQAQKARSAEERLNHFSLLLRRVGISLGLVLLLFAGLAIVRLGLARAANGAPARPWFIGGAVLFASLFVAAIYCGINLLHGPVPPDHGERLAHAPKQVEPEGSKTVAGVAGTEPIPTGKVDREGAAGVTDAASTIEAAKTGASMPKTDFIPKGVTPKGDGAKSPGFEDPKHDVGSRPVLPPVKEAGPPSSPVPPAGLPGPGGLGGGAGGFSKMVPIAPGGPPTMPTTVPGALPGGGGLTPGIPPGAGLGRGPKGFGGVAPGMPTVSGSSVRSFTKKGMMSQKPGAALPDAVTRTKAPVADAADPVVIVPARKVKSERDLRREGQFEELLFRNVAWDSLLPRTADPAILREFTFKPGQSPAHQETILWRPVLILHDGTANLSFLLPPRISAYQVLIFAHSSEGKLGSTSFEIHGMDDPPVER